MTILKSILLLITIKDRYKTLQTALERDRNVTIGEVLDDKFRYEDEPMQHPDLKDIESTYVERLEQRKGVNKSPSHETNKVNEFIWFR